MYELGEWPKIVSKWTGSLRVVSAGGQHVFSVKDILKGQRKDAHVAWTTLSVDSSLNATKELKWIVKCVKNSG